MKPSTYFREVEKVGEVGSVYLQSESLVCRRSPNSPSNIERGGWSDIGMRTNERDISKF